MLLDTPRALESAMYEGAVDVEVPRATVRAQLRVVARGWRDAWHPVELLQSPSVLFSSNEVLRKRTRFQPSILSARTQTHTQTHTRTRVRAHKYHLHAHEDLRKCMYAFAPKRTFA